MKLWSSHKCKCIDIIFLLNLLIGYIFCITTIILHRWFVYVSNFAISFNLFRTLSTYQNTQFARNDNVYLKHQNYNTWPSLHMLATFLIQFKHWLREYLFFFIIRFYQTNLFIGLFRIFISLHTNLMSTGRPNGLRCSNMWASICRGPLRKYCNFACHFLKKKKITETK